MVGTEVYDEADTDYEGFWARQADTLLDWYEDWHTILEWDLPFAKWFVGGKLNVAYNCLDRHVEAGRGDKVAYYWEGEPGDTRVITYAELLDDVSRLANALKALGVEKGDRVCIYMGMVPELPMALLACARIGAAHSVVFGGFSADSLARPHPGRRRQGARHGRRRVATRQRRAAEDHRRRRARRLPHDREDDRPAAHRPGRPDDRRPRRVVARSRARAVRRLPARADGLRGPALPPLHERHHGQAQGHHAHHGRLPHAGRVDAQARVRPAPRRRRLLVRGRRRLGHRPLVHRLRAARERRHERALRGHPRLPREGPALADHRDVRRHDPLHRAHRDPLVHEVGRGVAAGP